MYNFHPLYIRAEFYNRVVRITKTAIKKKFTPPGYKRCNQLISNGANIRHADARYTHTGVCTFLYVHNCAQIVSSTKS